MQHKPLTHLTLLTGHSRQSWRHEIDPAALAQCRALLDQALRGGQVSLAPSLHGYSMKATSEGDAMLCTALADVHGKPAPLVTFGASASAGVDLWRLLGQSGNPPPSPWCAVRVEPGLALAPEAAHWLGDFERCIAWAWLDRLTPPRYRGN